jgi:AmmeMemoRadiSam system protein A
MATLARWSEEVYMTPVDFQASGEQSHDYSLSVSYGALAFYPGSAYRVGAADRKKLLESARGTLDRYLTSGASEPVTAKRDAALDQRGGAFVTIRKNGELRGCIGTFEASMPLWQAIPERTLAAATADPRFAALRAAEGPVSIEISVLTPLKRLASWHEFRLGDGAVLMLGENAGTFLPQVASEMHWSRQQFLENLARKAGLPAQAYRDRRAVLYRFQAQVFQ